MEHAIDVPPEQLQLALAAFLARYPSRSERIEAAQAALAGSSGRAWRKGLGRWATWLVPVEELVPEAYRYWRPLVRDAMEFVVSRLSPARLAPKIVEQIELPPDLPSEERLLRLIEKVPGLQKIGQVLARNRNFDPRFRRALARLENGIADVGFPQIRAIISRELGPQMKTYRVKLGTRILSEASVSAVVPFTWRNPATRRRERGVFKVLKPHIPGCYAEDMRILQKLAGFLARKYLRDRSRFSGVAETLTEIRRLLEHEVDFRREQKTLAAADHVYGALPGVRVPRLIEPLSTGTITALTYEDGVKVTDALRAKSAAQARAQLAERLAESLLAVPTFLRQKEAIFHGDPHAGNLLYDKKRSQLVVLDWALTEHLSRDQRRLVVLLVLGAILRDPDRIRKAIEGLRLHRSTDDRAQARLVRATVTRFLADLPLWQIPGPMDALRLLDDVAQEGIRFPSPLVMFRKAAFTLEGVVEDVAGTDTVRMDTVLARYALTHWVSAGFTLWSLLSARDWIALQWSAATFGLRYTRQTLFRPLRWIERIAEAQAMAAEPTSG